MLSIVKLEDCTNNADIIHASMLSFNDAVLEQTHTKFRFKHNKAIMILILRCITLG